MSILEESSPIIREREAIENPSETSFINTIILPEEKPKKDFDPKTCPNILNSGQNINSKYSYPSQFPNLTKLNNISSNTSTSTSVKKGGKKIQTKKRTKKSNKKSKKIKKVKPLSA